MYTPVSFIWLMTNKTCLTNWQISIFIWLLLPLTFIDSSQSGMSSRSCSSRILFWCRSSSVSVLWRCDYCLVSSFILYSSYWMTLRSLSVLRSRPNSISSVCKRTDNSWRRVSYSTSTCFISFEQLTFKISSSLDKSRSNCCLVEMSARRFVTCCFRDSRY
jgi:hypothetical protein